MIERYIITREELEKQMKQNIINGFGITKVWVDEAGKINREAIDVREIYKDDLLPDETTEHHFD